MNMTTSDVPQTTKSSEGTAALEKALDIFEAIGAEPNGISQAELSTRLHVPRTTLYRLLASLVARGLVRRDPIRRVYCLGFKCFELARSAHSSGDLVSAAASEMRGIRDLTGETTYLGVAEGSEVLALERFDGAHSERSNATLGARKPMHCTSQGKAILSAMPEALRDLAVKELVLKPVTPRTITDRRRLIAELKISAARGYAVDDEEVVLGIRCVGAAIVDSQGNVRGAISVAGPAWRMTPERLEDLGPEVAEAARRVGAQLQPITVASAPTEIRELAGPWAFEGGFPCWSKTSDMLYYADCLAPAVFARKVAPDAPVVEVARLNSPIRSMALIDHDRLMVRCDDGVHLFETSDIAFTEARDSLSAAEVIKIDPLSSSVCSDSAGTLWVCAPASTSGVSPTNGYTSNQWAVGSLGPEGQLRAQWRLNEKLDSLCWDDRRQTLYGASASSGSIVIMQAGKPNVRRLTSVAKGSGRISGLAIDGEAGVWASLRDGWSLMRFSPEGSLDRMVSMPVPQPSGLCFVPPKSSDVPARLFVTSSRHTVGVEILAKGPQSGQLFEINLQD